jgi:hypothetical protein
MPCFLGYSPLPTYSRGERRRGEAAGRGGGERKLRLAYLNLSEKVKGFRRDHKIKNYFSPKLFQNSGRLVGGGDKMRRYGQDVLQDEARLP